LLSCDRAQAIIFAIIVAGVLCGNFFSFLGAGADLADFVELHVHKIALAIGTIGLMAQLGGWVWWASSLSWQTNSLDKRLVAVETRQDAMLTRENENTAKAVRLDERLADVVGALRDATENLRAIDKDAKERFSAIETYLYKNGRSGGKK
jgi:hypothetical protein